MKTHWQPVETSLPTLGESVLLFINGMDLHGVSMAVGRFLGEPKDNPKTTEEPPGWMFNSLPYKRHGVITHWMKLPEAPTA